MDRIQAVICLVVGMIILAVALTRLSMDKYCFRARRYWAAVDERVKDWMALSDALAALAAVHDAALEAWNEAAENFRRADTQEKRALAASRAPALFEAIVLPENERVRDMLNRRAAIENKLISDLADYNGAVRKLNAGLDRAISGSIGRAFGFSKLPELILGSEWRRAETEA